MFYTSPIKIHEIDEFVESNRRDVPYYYEEKDVAVKYVPVEGGEIRIFHHNPQNKEFKHPIIFVPGFGTPPLVWGDFSLPLHGKGEFVVVESREKRSSKIQKHRKANFTVNQMSKDLRDVINHLELQNTQYILVGGCWGGGIVLEGIIREYFKPHAVVLQDPYPKFVHKKIFAGVLFSLTPSFVLDIIKNMIGFIFLMGMKNKAQKIRDIQIVKEAVGWKWKKAVLQNLQYNLYPDFSKIYREIFLFHGPKDRYHSRELYFDMISKIPKGRFFFMNCSDKNRELLLGSVVKEFAANNNNDPLPSIFEKYELIIPR